MTRKEIGHYGVSILIKALAPCSALMNHQLRSACARVVALVLRLVSTARFEVTCDNIRQSLTGISDERIQSIARESYHNFALCFLELVATPWLSAESIAKQFRFSNLDVLQQTSFQERPLIMISAHFGNWEWGALSLARVLHRVVFSIAKPQRNRYVDAYVNRCRTSEWTRVLSMYDAAKDIISQMRNNGVIGMLIDQAADPKHDVFVDFFGRPAVCFSAPATLALRYSANLCCALAQRAPDGTYAVHFEPVPIDDLKDQSQAIQLIVQRCTKVLEDAIRNTPEQWSWQHRRWKYNPEDYKKGT